MREPDIPSAFGAALRQFRVAAGMTQEALASRAGCSVRGLSDLERGVRRQPRASTVRLFAEALGLAPAERNILLRAAFPSLSSRRADGAHSALHTAAERRTSTPVGGPLIGRSDDLSWLTVRLMTDAPRALTLTGPGGVGKTRLARAYVERIHNTAPQRYPGGVFWLTLADSVEPTAPLSAIAKSFRYTWAGGLAHMPSLIEDAEVAGAQLGATLAHTLAGQAALLVVDDCEHALAAAGQIEALLAACPSLTLLSVSREPWRLAEEYVYDVAPLSAPNPTMTTVEAIQATAAAQLFIQRVQRHDARFCLTATNARLVGQLCAWTAGIPLVIERLAICTQVYSLVELYAKLPTAPSHDISDAAAFLTLLDEQTTARDNRVASRHTTTFRTTLTRSYERLTPAEQQVFRAFAVCAGRWTREAVAAISGAETGATDGDAADAQWNDEPGVVLSVVGAFEALDSLVNKRFVVRAEATDGHVCYSLLPPIHAYAAEQFLQMTPTAQRAIELRHLRYYQGYLTRLQDANTKNSLNDSDQDIVDMTDDERATDLANLNDDLWRNLLAALRSAQRQQQIAASLSLGTELAPAFAQRGMASDGYAYLARALAMASAQPYATAPRETATQGHIARAYAALGALASAQGAAFAAERAFRTSLASDGRAGMDTTAQFDHLALPAEQNDQLQRAETLRQLGNALTLQGRYGEAIGALQQSIAGLHFDEDMTEATFSARAHTNLGYVYLLAGNVILAEQTMQSALLRQRQLGDVCGAAWSLNNLAELALTQDAYPAAHAYAEESLALFEADGDSWGKGVALMTLAATLQGEGQTENAARAYRASLDHYRSRNDAAGVMACLEGWSASMATAGVYRQATVGYSAATRLRRRLRLPRSARNAEQDETHIARLRTALGAQAYAAAWARGQRTALSTLLDEEL